MIILHISQSGKLHCYMGVIGMVLQLECVWLHPMLDALKYVDLTYAVPYPIKRIHTRT